MKTLKLIIRADGNSKVGMGHLKRQADVALEMMRQSWEVSLYAPESEASALELFDNIVGHKVLRLTSPSLWKRELESSDVLVVDVLQGDNDENWMSNLKGGRNVPTVVFTDDSFVRSCYADAIINSNPCNLTEKRSWYSGKHIFAGLGLEWFMAGRDLLNVRDRYKCSGVLKKLGIVFGGADQWNSVAIILEMLQEYILQQHIEIDILQSPISRFSENNIKRFCKPGIRFHSHVGSVAEFISQFDLLIGSHGNIAYEACVVGVPMIAVNHVSRQNEQATQMQLMGAVVNAGMDSDLNEKEITSIVSRYNQSAEDLKEQSFKKRALVDGQGIIRLRELVSAIARSNAFMVK